MGKKGDGSTPATLALTKLGIDFTSHSYTHDASVTHFGDEAAASLGVEPGRIFKTLLAEVEGLGGRSRSALAVAIVPVTGRLDLKALAQAVGGKRAVMADPAVAERKAGYIVGGISPLGQRTKLPTVLDDSATAHDTILVSGGRRGFDIELAPDDLRRATEARTAPIARPS